jgi:hypothetical protein
MGNKKAELFRVPLYICLSIILFAEFDELITRRISVLKASIKHYD